jgi:hypothetical protein
MWAIVITFRSSSVVRSSTFHILIFSSETTGPIATKLWWNGPWMTDWQSSWISDLHKNEHFVEDHPMIIHSWFGFINQVIYCLWEKLFYSFSIGSKLLHPYIKTDLLRWPSCICSWHSCSCKILQKPLGQLQPNFGGMVLGWPPSKIVSGDPNFQPRWPPC